MSGLRALIEGERALLAALDGDDPQAIAGLNADCARAIAAIGDGRALTAADRPLAEEALALADAARARINALADRNRRRLAATGLGAATPTYGRDARMRG